MNIETKENSMSKVAITLALLAVAIAVPVAQAAPPDVFERAVIAHRVAANSVPAERRSPDARDAAITTRRSDGGAYGPLDPAIASAISNYRSLSAVVQRRSPDARDVALWSRVSVPAGVKSNGFDWSDSAIGAGAMLGLLLSIYSVRKAVFTLHSSRAHALQA